jgi:flagellar motor switch protein FliN/FliY
MMADEDDDWDDDDEDDDWDDDDEDLESRRAADLIREEEMRAAERRQEDARLDAVALASRRAREDVEVELTAVLGTADVVVNNLLKVGRGAVIELNKTVDDLIELQANGKPIGDAEVVVSHDKLAVSLVKLYKK